MSEGILLALSPALAYVVAFRFEASYLRWYGLPSDLVDLSLDRVVASWTIILVLAVMIVLMVGTLPARPWHLVLTRLFTVMMAWSGVSLLLLLRPAAGIGRWLMTGVAVLFGLFFLLWILIESVVPLLKHRDLPKWLDRYAREDVAVAAKTPDNVLTWAADRGGLKIFWSYIVIWLFFCSFLLAGFLGKTVASLSGRHLVVSGTPECAVIRRYGNHLVCLEIDRATRRYGRRVRLLAMDGMPNDLLHVEDLYFLPLSDRDTAKLGVQRPDHSTHSTEREPGELR